MDDDELERLRRVNRRMWGAALASSGVLVLLLFAAGMVFLLWLWSLVEGSPTIS